jgi:hypothetical protein
MARRYGQKWTSSADPEPASVLALQRSNKTIKDIDNGSMSPDVQTMRRAIEVGASVSKGLDEELVAGMQKAGNMSDFDGSDFPSPAVFGTTPISARKWTPFMEMFAGTDQVGRACLVIESLKRQQIRLLQTREDCNRRIAQYNTQIATLETNITRYREMCQAAEGKVKEQFDVATLDSDLENHRSELENDPFEVQRRETLERENRTYETGHPVAPPHAYRSEFPPPPRYFHFALIIC